ncbi:RasGEF [Actinomortierella wolfii]|nr:RasGEF [Actinomortierella wolfii]
MEEIESMQAKSADAVSAGNFKDAYLCYLDIIDAVTVELRKVKFIANVAIPSASTANLIAITRSSVTHVQEILSRHNAAIAAISETPPPPAMSRKSSLARHQDRIQAGQVKTVTMLTEQLQQQAAAMAASASASASDQSNSPESPFLSRISSFSSNTSTSPMISPQSMRTPVIPPKPIRRPPLVHRSSMNAGVEVLGSSPSSTIATNPTTTLTAIAETTAPSGVTTTEAEVTATPVSTSDAAAVTTESTTDVATSAIAEVTTATTIGATTATTTATTSAVARTPPTRPIPAITSPAQPSSTSHLSPILPSTPQCTAQQSSSDPDSPPRSKPPLPPKPARLYRKLDEDLQTQVDDQTDEDDDSDDDDDDEDIEEDPSHLAIYSGSLSRRASSPSIAIPQPARRPGTPLSVPNSPTISPSSLSSAVSSNDRSRSFTLPQFSGPGPTGSFISVIPDGSVDPTNLVEAERISGDDGDDHKPYAPSDHIPMIPVSPLRTTHRTLVEKEKTWSSKLNETHQLIHQLKEKSKEGEANDEDLATVEENAKKYSSMLANVQSTITKVRELLYRSVSITSILEFPAYLVAYQLTLIESAIFLEIPPSALLTHSPKTPHRAITASTDFFNYLTRMIEYSVLYPPEASGRAQCIHYWVKLAVKLHELGNFQTLKAVLSALGTPPIKRLKRTWSFLPRKSAHKLETLQDLMSETRNYGKYREMMNSIMGGAMGLSPGSVSPVNSLSVGSSGSTPKLEILGLNNVANNFSNFSMRSKEVAARRPMVPFLGTFIMDITYLLAAVKKSSSSAPPVSAQIPSTSSLRERPGSSNDGTMFSSPSINTHFAPEDDPRIQDLLMTLSAYQSGPKYSPQPPRPYIKAATKNHHHFRAPSLSSALHRTAKYRTSSVDRQIGSNINHQSSYDEDEDDIAGSGLRPTQQLILHYLLTRPWVPERMVDEVSMIREPSKNKNSSSSSGTSSARASSSGGPGTTGSTGSWVALGGGGSMHSSSTSTAQRGSTGSGGSSRPTSIDE